VSIFAIPAIFDMSPSSCIDRIDAVAAGAAEPCEAMRGVERLRAARFRGVEVPDDPAAVFLAIPFSL
jgi:hypothetical protein